MRRARLVPLVCMAIVLGWLGTASTAWADHGGRGYRPPSYHGYHGSHYSYHDRHYDYRPPPRPVCPPVVVTPWLSLSIGRYPPPPPVILPYPPPPPIVRPYYGYRPVVVW